MNLTPDAIVRNFNERGLEFSLAGEHVAVTPAEQLSDDDRAVIRENRDAIAAYIRARDESEAHQAGAAAVQRPISTAPGRSRADTAALHRLNHSDHVPNSAVDRQIDDIYGNDNSRERFALIEQLPMACRGVIARHFLAVEQIRLVGKLGGNGVKVWNAKQPWLRDFLQRNIGPLMQACCNYTTPDGTIEFADDVLPEDAPAAPIYAQPDPQGGQRAMFSNRATQRDAIAWIDSGLTYWGLRKAAVNAELLQELAGELDEPAIAAGVSGFESCWIRLSDGRLIVVKRLDD